MDLKPFSSVIAAMLALIVFTQYSVRDRSAEKFAASIVTESGRPLHSLFEGLVPNPAANEVGLRPVEVGECAAQPAGEPSLAQQFWSWFNPPTVLAFHCAESQCGSHYIDFITGFCGLSCDNSYYQFNYSNPNEISYEWGWKWTGNDACNGCKCEEENCWNP